MEKAQQSGDKKLDQDFSKPWELSDVILLVEGDIFMFIVKKVRGLTVCALIEGLNVH